MAGAFGSVQAAVSAVIASNSLPGGATTLWIRGRDAAGNWGAAEPLPVQVNGAATDVDLDAQPVVSFSVDQNVPNPFVSNTRIRFALPESRAVSLKVYNVEGRLVRTLADRAYPAGRHELAWDGNDGTGSRVTSGVYFYRFSAGPFESEKKMVVLK